jgi:hypothetical protein
MLISTIHGGGKCLIRAGYKTVTERKRKGDQPDTFLMYMPSYDASMGDDNWFHLYEAVVWALWIAVGAGILGLIFWLGYGVL